MDPSLQVNFFIPKTQAPTISAKKVKYEKFLSRKAKKTAKTKKFFSPFSHLEGKEEEEVPAEKNAKQIRMLKKPIAKPKKILNDEPHHVPTPQSYTKKFEKRPSHPSPSNPPYASKPFPPSYQSSSLPPSSSPHPSSFPHPLPPPPPPPSTLLPPSSLPPSSSLSPPPPPLPPPPTSVFTSDLFADLPIESRLRDSLARSGFEKLTGIQKIAIVNILGGCDTLVKSETGSGKTLCYLIPLLERLGKKEKRVERGDGTYAIVLCPTRELCVQVVQEATRLVQLMIWIVIGSIMGGENIQKEKARLRKGINLLVTTPGRLIYHLQNTAALKIDKLEVLVLEESDRILDMGFQKEMISIAAELEKKTNFAKVQKILIAATFTQKVKSLSLRLSPKEIKCIGLDQNQNESEQTEYLPVDQQYKVPSSIRQYYVSPLERFKFATLFSYISKQQTAKIIIFVFTIDEVEFYSQLFVNLNFSGEIHKLHGNVDQKERTKTYFAFRKTENLAILFATEVAARGLDFDNVTHTILFDVPNSIVDYCNIIGRTGRIDKAGISILFLLDCELKFLSVLGSKELRLDTLNYTSKELPDINGEVKSILAQNYDLKILGKRTLVSFLRAYARLDKSNFHVKNLNQGELRKNLGLNEAGVTKEDLKSKEYREGMVIREREKIAEVKKRKVIGNRDLERMEFG